jgi:phosphatidate cytidylyltransferase
MNNFIQRVFTGLILVMVIFYLIIYGPLSFILLMLAINILGLLEFYRLFNSYTTLPRNIMGVILSAGILITCILVISGKGNWRVLLVNIPLVFGIFITELYLKSKNPFQNLAFIFLGILCITIPLCFFMALTVLPTSPGIYPSGYYPYVVLGYFFILWSNDSGAYFAGKYLGKRPLFLRLSPGKTWTGSLGGTICALTVAFFLPGIFSTLSRIEWLSIALIIIVTGTYGDLIKSMMKRSLGVKDSGTILPGHGGILDRFDTLLGSAPFVFCYLSLTGHA